MKMSSMLSSLVFLTANHSTKCFSKNKLNSNFIHGIVNQHSIKLSNNHIHATSKNDVDQHQDTYKINLLTIQQSELETLLSSWNEPKYRAKQIVSWIHEKGITSIDEMNNLPKSLRAKLEQASRIGSLRLDVEVVSKDGTIKRAYKLEDGQYIESVLMPYSDGRRTACISSQAGCAMGCVFCATGQMGFARQLTSDEIFEQVARFACELQKSNERVSNVVMMGMGEPLANYRNVMDAIRRMNSDLGIGARKITVSTVGVVPNIKKLIQEDIQIRLAISLHCATEEERTALLPANKRYGGLHELMTTVKEYITATNRRVTFEWALIENENDTPEVARTLGNLIDRYELRRDMVHINLIPLNPTGGFERRPTAKKNVDRFVSVLESEFGLAATPRVRRGIDIDAGCGQLKASIQKKNLHSLTLPGVYEEDDQIDKTTIANEESINKAYKRRKKIQKELNEIQKLKDMHGKLKDDEIIKINKEGDLLVELESVEHNLK